MSIDAILDEEGIAIDATTRTRMLQEVHKAWTQAAEQQLKRAEGDFSPDPQAARLPSPAASQPSQRSGSGPALSAIFDGWKKDHLSNGKSPRTVDDFAQKKDALVNFFGHEDPQRIPGEEAATGNT